MILYNTLSCLGWVYILVVTFLHLTNVPLPDILNTTSEGPSVFSFQALATYIRELVEEIIREAKGLLAPSNNMFIAAIIPPQLLDIYTRMTTTYDVVGRAVALVQTAAALEILHALSGLVKSPLPTAVIQVYSRLFLVWGVTQKYEQVCSQFPILATHAHASCSQSRHNPLYSTMILAWSTTEVIRYAFYALSLVRGTVPSVLIYLRYTTFYVLYPLGASSEALLILSSLPTVNPLQGLKDGSWSPWDYFRGVMFVVWWPGVCPLYSASQNTDPQFVRTPCDDVAHGKTAEEGVQTGCRKYEIQVILKSGGILFVSVLEPCHLKDCFVSRCAAAPTRDLEIVMALNVYLSTTFDSLVAEIEHLTAFVRRVPHLMRLDPRPTGDTAHQQRSRQNYKLR